MTRLRFLLFIFLTISNLTALYAQKPPNIIVIFTDDLGYGDVSCLNPNSKIQTPNIDKVATNGITFTDAHTASAVCTPSRYGILTGRYAWRSKLKSGVLWGYSKPLIKSSRLTVASMLKKQGYNTACIGKWHLGLDWELKPDALPLKTKKDITYGGDRIDFSKKIKNGPTTLGFDYYYGHAASLDMPPYFFIENDKVLATEFIKTKKSFGRLGMADTSLTAEAYLPKLSEKAVTIIDKYSAEKAPFFLYLPLPSPHTPLAVAKQFKNSTNIGAYGDYVVETDWVVGEVLKALEKNNITDNTLIIVTSDNGPEKMMIKRKTEYNHYSTSNYRGCKRDNWEGGHRVPFFAQWPNKIKAGTKSDEILCMTDLMKTFAAITNYKLPENAAEDSYNMLPALLNKKHSVIREATIHHSVSGKFAIRKGDWVLLLHSGSGGNDNDYKKNTPDLFKEPIALYNLKIDPDQTNNVYKSHPKLVKKLYALTLKYIEDGRSTNGTSPKNDVEWKQLKDLKSLDVNNLFTSTYEKK